MEIGKTHLLEISRIMPQGAYLQDMYQTEVLLPSKFLLPHHRAEDKLEVFVYHDSQGRPIATTDVPKAEVDQFVISKVKTINEIGAFLEWGIEKDLFLPYSEQTRDLKEGDPVIARVLWDERSERVVCTMKIREYTEEVTEDYRNGSPVTLNVIGFADLGVNVLVNKRFLGLIYKDSVDQHLNVGQELEGYIKLIREDGKLDISLDPVGYTSVMSHSDMVLQKLSVYQGFLPLHDKSTPEDIRDVFNLSKKAFKKIIGGLYRNGQIRIEDDGIHLVKK